MKANREESGQAFLARLEAHPELKARMERILDLAENAERDVFRASEAEERTIREINALGREVLQDWAWGLAEETSQARAGEIRDKKKTPLAQ
jgi:hypothetical protein